MKTLPIRQLNVPAIINAAKKLNNSGTLLVSKDNLTYLDIEDDYIHQLFPLLQESKIIKPDYFGDNLVGAHVSVIYPEENIVVDKGELGTVYNFEIEGLFSAVIGEKKYYVLTVYSPSLLHFRKRYALASMLPFKNYLIGFHITVGVEMLNPHSNPSI